METSPAKALRITMTELPPREERMTDAQLEQILLRITVPEGHPCHRDCDCGIGLVCRQGVCTSDW